MTPTFFGSGDDLQRHYAAIDVRCLVCGAPMTAQVMWLRCSNGHDRLNFNLGTRSCFTAPEVVSRRLEPHDAHVEKTGDMWYVEP